MAPVEVVSYDPSWPERYQEEADRIRAALGSTLRVIEHVGSTSVPGLAAKPVVDIAASVESFADIDVGALETVGYAYMPECEDVLPDRRYFRRRGFHLHVYEQEDEAFLDYVRLRDYLRAHPEDAAAYGDLKLRLAAEHADDRAPTRTRRSRSFGGSSRCCGADGDTTETASCVVRGASGGSRSCPRTP